MRPYPTMPNRFRRLLMLWLVIALQAWAPFIHAHAGTAHFEHSDLLHVHQGVQGDAAYHAVSSDELGPEIVVEQGLRVRVRHAAVTVAAAPPAAPRPLPAEPVVARPSASLALPHHLPQPPDHARPHALAPPLR
jgi:hypothetical protein